MHALVSNEEVDLQRNQKPTNNQRIPVDIDKLLLCAESGWIGSQFAIVSYACREKSPRVDN